MIHKKSIPNQTLLYFNNFLDFSYVYSLRNLQIVFRNLDYLKVFIKHFFVMFLGFSINLLRVDYFFDTVEVYIDLLVVSYKVRTGFVFKRNRVYSYKKNLDFLFKDVFKFSFFCNKWIDAFLYQFYKIYKSGISLSYRYRFCSSLFFCQTGKLRWGSSFNLKKSKLSFTFVDINIHLLKFVLLFVFDYLNFDFGYLFWCYCFMCIIWSLRMDTACFFDVTLLNLNNYFTFLGRSFIFRYTDLVNCDLLGFLRMYSSYFVEFSYCGLQFFYYFFFKFLFYNLLFFRFYVSFWTYCINFFLFLFYFWTIISWRCFPQETKVFSLFQKYSFTSVLRGSFKRMLNNPLNSKPNLTISNTRFYIQKRLWFSSLSLYRHFKIKLCFYCKCYHKNIFSKLMHVNVVFVFDLFIMLFPFDCSYYLNMIPMNAKKNVSILIGTTLRNRQHRKRVFLFHPFVMYNIVFDFWYLNSVSIIGFSYLYGYFRLEKKSRFCVYNKGQRLPSTCNGIFSHLYKRCIRARGGFGVLQFLRKVLKNNINSVYFFKTYGVSSGFKSKFFFFFIHYFIILIEYIYQYLLQLKLVAYFVYFILLFLRSWTFSKFLGYIFFLKKKTLSKQIKQAVYTLPYSVSLYDTTTFFNKSFSTNLQNFIMFFKCDFVNFFFKFYSDGFMFVYWKKLAMFSAFERMFCFVHNVFRYNTKNTKFYIRKVIGRFVFTRNVGSLRYISLIFRKVTFDSKCKYVSLDTWNFGKFLCNFINNFMSRYNLVSSQYFVVLFSSLFLLYNLKLQLRFDFQNVFIKSYMLFFNLKYLKSLSVLFCFFFFSLDFFFKFYIKLFMVNFNFFCDFFYYIFRVNNIFSFLGLKFHLVEYRFCGMLGLYLLLFKFSNFYINIVGNYILDYLYDIFYYVFLTNRYKQISYILHVLYKMFCDFIDSSRFVGLNFKIKGRLSKRTQRKRAFILNKGIINSTDSLHMLYVGNRILTTHIGSVSINLIINFCKRSI